MIKNAKRSKRFISLLILSVMILSMGIPVAYAQSTPVSDIANHWAKNEISAWIEQGFITGYLDSTFKPDNSITRAEFIALVNRRFAFSEKGPVSFTDVKESDWFYADFAKASKAGYLSGYASTVGPDGFITRQEVAVIAAKVKSLQEDAAAANGFADAAMIPAGSKGFIGAVAKAKIMNGYPDEKFEPTKGITRAESVITLNRLMSLKDSVKIEAIKDQTATVSATTIVALKMLTAGATATIQSSDSSIAQATLSGTNIQLRGLKVGTATITVTGKKDGMLDGVISFKVVVGAAIVSTTSGGGGGGGGGSHGGGGGPITPPADENAVTVVQPIVGATTEVTGTYKNGVAKVEVTYGTVTLTPALANGTFHSSITPGLAIGTSITVKAYVGTTLVDTDVTTVAEDDSKLTEVKAIGIVATEVSGKYAAGVGKVEVICGSTTYEAVLNSNGTFFRKLVGLQNGTLIVVKAYVNGILVDTDEVTLGTAPADGESYITDLKAIGIVATEVSGKYAGGVSKIEVICDSTTYEAVLNPDGTFFRKLVGLQNGTLIVAKAYVNGALVDTDEVTLGTAPVTGEASITDLKAIGIVATEVTGKYAAGVDRIEVICGGTTYEAVLNPNGTFFRKLVGLQNGALIVAKAYVNGALVDTDEVTLGTAPVEEDLLSDVQAKQGVMFVQVTGKCAASVDRIEIVFNGESENVEREDDGTFEANIVTMGLTQVTVNAYVDDVLRDSVQVDVQ